MSILLSVIASGSSSDYDCDRQRLRSSGKHGRFEHLIVETSETNDRNWIFNVTGAKNAEELAEESLPSERTTEEAINELFLSPISDVARTPPYETERASSPLAEDVYTRGIQVMEHKAPVLGLMDTEGLKATRKMLTVRKHDQQGKGEDHQDRDSTPQASGLEMDFSQEANQDAVDLTVHKFDSYKDTHSGQDLGDEDNGARGTYCSDSDQETVCGYGSGEDKDSFGRNHKAADNANDPGHSYEDEDGDHQYEYVDHRNNDKDLEDSDADSQATSDSEGTTSAVKKLD
ncbi:hypothetical protein BGZ90_003479 [Linnemannia elongata]|nr:hypothetical protein BGZ90_003479 [Linnemannia elongata]